MTHWLHLCRLPGTQLKEGTQQGEGVSCADRPELQMQDGHKDPGLKNILDPINSHMCIVPLRKWLFIGVRSQEEHAYVRGQWGHGSAGHSLVRAAIRSQSAPGAELDEYRRIYFCPSQNLLQLQYPGQCKMIFMVCLYVSTCYLEKQKKYLQQIHNNKNLSFRMK